MGKETPRIRQARLEDPHAAGPDIGPDSPELTWSKPMLGNFSMHMEGENG